MSFRLPLPAESGLHHEEAASFSWPTTMVSYGSPQGLLELEADIEVVGEASNGREAVERATLFKPEPDHGHFDAGDERRPGHGAAEKSVS